LNFKKIIKNVCYINEWLNIGNNCFKSLFFTKFISTKQS
jgi:hypothetical protein